MINGPSLIGNTESSSIPIKILIIDDSEIDRTIYRFHLLKDKEKNYEIIEAETLEEGWELWTNEHPHLVLVDINLPDGNGLELVENIRKTEKSFKLPVIVMTGQGNERIAVQAMKLGASDYLVKEDITFNLFCRSVSNTLSQLSLFYQLDRLQQHDALVAQIALHIRQSINLTEIYNAVVQDVRSLLNADRVLIYKFMPDMSGVIVAESVLSPWEASLHAQVIDTCFQQTKGKAYQSGRIFAAADIYKANLTPCHVELLERFQVRANLVVPILLPQHSEEQPSLWGLLVVHQCSGPRFWEESDVDLMKRLSVQLAIALQQGELYQNLQVLNNSLEEKVTERTTELQTLLQQYQEAETTLKFQARILEEIHDAVVSTDTEGIVYSWNAGAERLFGYSAEEMLGHNIDILYENFDELQTKVIQPLLTKGQDEVEVKVHTKTGESLYISLRLSTITDEQGEIIRLLGCSNDISQRKKVEFALKALNQQLETRVEQRTIALQQSEKRLRETQQFARLGSWEINTLTNQCIWSAELYEIFRLNPEDCDLSPQQLRHFFSSQDFVLLKQCFQQAIDRKEAFEVDVQIIRADGTTGYILAKGKPGLNLEGQVTHLLGFAMDITERKVAEENLRKSEQRFVTLAAAAPVAIFRIDQLGNCIYVNDFWSRITGQETTVALGNGWINTIHPEDRERILNSWNNALSQNGYYQGQGRALKPNGEITWYYCQALPEFDANNTITGYIGTLTDITEHKKNEEELRNLSTRLELALKSANIGTWEFDLWNNSQIWDERMYNLFGRSPQSVSFDKNAWQTFLSFIHPDDLSLFEDLSPELLNNQKDLNMEFRIIRPDGSIRTLQSNAIVIKNQQNIPERLIGINYDISERKNYEIELQETNAQLARATRLKDEFLANMSHELRTPLNAILGMSEGLQDEVFGSINLRQLEAVGLIERSGRHLLDLINDILDLAKIEAGKLELEYEWVLVSNLCQNSVVFVKQMAFAKQIQIHTQIDQQINQLWIDERRIRQVLINLLSNAVKFTPQGGQICLDVRLRESEILISVSDTGIGIAPDYLSKLFQPFMQIDSSLSRQHSGTGLGLALVQRIIAQHGGTISVESTLGQGSCFTIHLPLSPQALTSVSINDTNVTFNPEVQETVNSPSAINVGHSPLILVADDNEGNSKSMEDYLNQKGYQLLLARNGLEAVELAIQHQPDLIFMDIQMPEMDGLEATSHIRSNSATAQIPIVVLTALAFPQDSDRFLATGANEYLSKPVRFKQIIEVIKKYCSK